MVLIKTWHYDLWQGRDATLHLLIWRYFFFSSSERVCVVCVQPVIKGFINVIYCFDDFILFPKYKSRSLEKIISCSPTTGRHHQVPGHQCEVAGGAAQVPGEANQHGDHLPGSQGPGDPLGEDGAGQQWDRISRPVFLSLHWRQHGESQEPPADTKQQGESQPGVHSEMSGVPLRDEGLLLLLSFSQRYQDRRGDDCEASHLRKVETICGNVKTIIISIAQISCKSWRKSVLSVIRARGTLNQNIINSDASHSRLENIIKNVWKTLRVNLQDCLRCDLLQTAGEIGIG